MIVSLTLFTIKKFSKRQLPYYIIGVDIFFLGLIGGFLGYFELHPFSHYTNNKGIVGLSFTLNNLVYWISMLSTDFSYLKYKDESEFEFRKEFDYDEKRMDRENKINKIIGKGNVIRF